MRSPNDPAKSRELHELLLNSFVYIAVDKPSHDYWAAHQGALGRVRYYVVSNETGDRALAIFSSPDRMQRFYRPGTFGIGLRGRSAFEMALKNNESVILNYKSSPTVRWDVAGEKAVLSQ